MTKKRNRKAGDLAWIWSASGPISALIVDVDPSEDALTYYLVSSPDREPEWLPEMTVFSSPAAVTHPWQAVVTHPWQARRVHSSLIMNDIVKVQPMPQGALSFYFDEVERRMNEDKE